MSTNPPTGPSGNPYVQKATAFARQRPIVAGIAALIVVCLACGICGSIGQAISGGGSSTPANGAAVSGGSSSAKAGPTATPKPTATATATPKPKAWVTVKTFSGSATTQTDTLAIPDGAHIVWSCQKADSFGGNFAVTLYQDDGTLIDLIANTTDNNSGTYTLHQGFASSGKYYFSVDTYSENWTIKIQVYK